RFEAIDLREHIRGQALDAVELLDHVLTVPSLWRIAGESSAICRRRQGRIRARPTPPGESAPPPRRSMGGHESACNRPQSSFLLSSPAAGKSTARRPVPSRNSSMPSGTCDKIQGRPDLPPPLWSRPPRPSCRWPHTLGQRENILLSGSGVFTGTA